MTGTITQPTKNGMRQPQALISSAAIQRLSAIAKPSGNDDRDLLARRLPTGIEALVAGRGHFGEVDRNATELRARGKALQQTADQHQQRARAKPMDA